MIEIRRITSENMNERSLDGFERTQEVARVFRRVEGEYKLVDAPFTMDWDLPRKREIARSLMNDDVIAYAAFDGQTLAGILAVESSLRGDRLVLDMISVSRPYRRLGLGKRLFQLALDEAKAMGARQLYLSAFSGEATISFYKAMGCAVADDPIPEIVRDEPMDVQMTVDIAK